MLMQADSHDDMLMWVKALRLAVAAKKSPKAPVPGAAEA